MNTLTTERQPKYGKLYPYFETGTEGILWALIEDGKAGYDALHILEDGDHLKVWERESGRQVLDQVIKYDHKVGAKVVNRVGGSKDGTDVKAQVALGMYVNGVQDGFDPDDWARLFVRDPSCVELRAEVLPRGKRVKVVDRESTKASPRQWRSKQASKMARSTGKSRFASGRRGSGRSSKH